MKCPGNLFLPFIILLGTPFCRVSAQLFEENPTAKYDTSYIRVYKDELTTRVFLSRKQNGYTLSERLLSPWIKYRTNDHLLLGMGYTYNFLTLNLALKMPFINGDDDLYGKSRYLDLQSHTIFRNMIVDMYLQWNKGFYLSNPDEVLRSYDPGSPFPYRGDMRTNIIGLNIQHLFNSDRFSYKASFVQNELQKRSAGSPMLGVEGYWVLGMSDSLIIPESIPSREFAGAVPFNQADMFNVGVNAGYAYTFVWGEKFFLSVATVIGLAGSYFVLNHTETSTQTRPGLSLGVNNHNRVSLGFNKNDFYIGLSLIQFNMSNSLGYPDGRMAYSTGNIRLNVVKRFKLKRSIWILRPDLWFAPIANQ